MAPPPNLKVSEWADRERILPDTSAEPGRWRTSRTPYLKEPLDSISSDDVDEIIMMFSTQVGKTEVLLNAIGYHIALDPCPMLLVEPDLNVSKTMSKTRIRSMLEDAPSLRGKVKDPRTRDSDNTILEKLFPGGYLVMAGANSPASLSNRPIRKLFLDEIDRYKPSAGTEGDPSSLAEKRLTTFSHSKQIIRVSSPSLNVGASITSHYKRSDQRKYYLPCPHCAHLQLLKFAGFNYSTKKNADDKETIIPETVFFKCGKCRRNIEESDKAEMLAKGAWIAEGDPGPVRGYWINEFYSPWKPWKDVLQDYLNKKDDPQTLKTFFNTSLCELVDSRGEAPGWKTIYNRREQYQIGAVPYGPLVLFAGADVQKNRIEVEVVGYGRGKESWSIDYLVFEGDTSTVDSEPWKKLAELLNTEFQHASGAFLPIRRMAVDRNYRTNTVDSWVRQQPRSRVIAVRGQESLPAISIGAKTVDFKQNGKTKRRGMRYWPVGTSKAKEEFYDWLNLEVSKDSPDRRPCFCHFPEYPEEYFKQLTAESQKPKIVRGSPGLVWTKDYERNEALDCRVYARAAAFTVGIDKWGPRDWDNLAAVIPERGEIKQIRQDAEPEKPAAEPSPPLRKKREPYL